jgi:hypothetical protein
MQDNDFIPLPAGFVSFHALDNKKHHMNKTFEIRIVTNKNESCKNCPYVVYEPVPFMNTFAGQWRCRLFNEDLYTRNFDKATLRNETPRQCIDCKEFIKRHLATPEFEG